MKQLKVAVIGCGTISKAHVDSIVDEGEKLVAVVDLDNTKMDYYQSRYNCNTYHDFEKMLITEKPDVVHILTPHYLHKKMIIKASKFCHVLTEKPLALSINEAEEIIEASKSSKFKIGVCFQNRFKPSTIKIKELINSNELGKLIGMSGIVTWYREKSYYTNSVWRGSYKKAGGGVLINQAIHTLDLLQYYGGEIEDVRGSRATRLLSDLIEVEDVSEATIQFKNGVSAIFYATNNHKTDSEVKFELVFEKGVVFNHRNNLYLDDGNVLTLLVSDEQGQQDKAYWGNYHHALIHNFYKNIKNNLDDYVSVEEASITIRMIDKINQY